MPGAKSAAFSISIKHFFVASGIPSLKLYYSIQKGFTLNNFSLLSDLCLNSWQDEVFQIKYDRKPIHFLLSWIPQHRENSHQLVGVTRSSIVKRYERKAIDLAVMVLLLSSVWKVDVLREVPWLSMHRFWRRQHCPIVKRRPAWISCMENSYAIGHLNPRLGYWLDNCKAVVMKM